MDRGFRLALTRARERSDERRPIAEAEGAPPGGADRDPGSPGRRQPHISAAIERARHAAISAGRDPDDGEGHAIQAQRELSNRRAIAVEPLAPQPVADDRDGPCIRDIVFADEQPSGLGRQVERQQIARGDGFGVDPLGPAGMAATTGTPNDDTAPRRAIEAEHWLPAAGTEPRSAAHGSPSAC